MLGLFNVNVVLRSTRVVLMFLFKFSFEITTTEPEAFKNENAYAILEFDVSSSFSMF